MEHDANSLDQYVKSWNPSPVFDTDPMDPRPTVAVSALLNLRHPAARIHEPLPPLWHWFHFLQWPRQDEIGSDGHPSDGHFLPPIPDRQRMFAGGRCEIHVPLVLGQQAERVSSLANVELKHGRTGQLLFVTQRNELRQSGSTRVVEELDLVYRSGRSTAKHPRTVDTSTAAPAHGRWQLHAQPDPTQLFRFSALTANAHRIHYDFPYVRDIEGYPDLVVHGPMLAVLMLELVRRNASATVRHLSFRLHSPVFVGEQLIACGVPERETASLHVATGRDSRHATAEVEFA